LTPDTAIASCASVNSMPINLSVTCNISLVIRGAGVGDACGAGAARLVGLCASEFNGSLVATIPAAPIAGSNFTKVRRLEDVFSCDCFLFGSVLRFTDFPQVPFESFDRNHRSCSSTLCSFSAVLQPHHFRLTKPIDRDDIKIIVLSLRNYRKRFAT